MDSIKKLLEKNQWSRPSPTLRVGSTKQWAPTCPICYVPEQHAPHAKECWLGQAIDMFKEHIERRNTLNEKNAQFRADVTKLSNMVTDRNITIKELTSHLAGMRTNRDALLNENRRYRALINSKGSEIAELKSEHEGQIENVNKVLNKIIEQLEEQLQSKTKRPEGMHIRIIQMSGKIYYWALMVADEQLAKSRIIDHKDLVEPEADKLASQLNLPVVVEERK